MSKEVVILFNAPESGRYLALGEAKAALGVLGEVVAVHQALTELGYEVAELPLSPPLEKTLAQVKDLKADLVFNLFEGFEAEPASETAIAEALSEASLPFTGCPAKAIALAQDKAKALSLLREAGITIPEYQILDMESLFFFPIAFPCIVKPVGEHASHGLSSESVVFDREALAQQVLRVCRSYSGKALVEEFIDGREFNATIMGNKDFILLPVSEIVYTLPSGVPKILTFAAKWEEDSPYYQKTKAHCPAELSIEEETRIKEIALDAYKLIGCRGYARVDVRQDKEGLFRVLEVNPNPDISPTAGTALQAKTAGMTYTQFIEKIIMLALEREEL